MVAKAALDLFAETFGKKFKNRHRYVGGSEVGQCQRKIWYIKHGQIVGVLPDVDFEESYGAKHRGTVFEDAFWTPAMRARYGDNILYTGKQQKHWRVGNLSGAPDGLLIKQPKDALAHLFVPDIGRSGAIVLDCKTSDPRAWAHLNKAKAEHVFQMHTNIGLIRENGLFQPEYGVISYINASFFDDIVEFAVRFDEKIYENAKHRADLILRTTDPKDMKPEGWIAGGKECDYCPYERPCRALRGNVPKVEEQPLDPQLAAEFADLARAQQVAAEEAANATSRKREIEETIKGRLRDHSLRVVEAGGTRIVWSSVKGRTSIDMTQLREACKAAGIEISEFEKTGDPSDRLLVTVSARSEDI